MMLIFVMNWVNDGELNSVVSWMSFFSGIALILGLFIVHSYLNSKINMCLMVVSKKLIVVV